jgi:hypothetical protein
VFWLIYSEWLIGQTVLYWLNKGQKVSLIYNFDKVMVKLCKERLVQGCIAASDTSSEVFTSSAAMCDSVGIFRQTKLLLFTWCP